MGRYGRADNRYRWRLGLRSSVVASVVAATVFTAGSVAVARVPAQSGPAVVPGTPCSATAKACVDLGAHQVWLIRDGQVIRGPASMSDGDQDEETPTPVGTFRVEWKNKDHVSAEFGRPMPYAVFFAPGGIAFHEGSLQTASAGCVRLVRDDAIAFFDYLQVGDEVQVR